MGPKLGLREMVLLKNTAETPAAPVAGGTEGEDECPQLVLSTDDQIKTDQDYFAAYDSVEVHRLMVRDQARTEAYQRAILENKQLFLDKIVMDVGAGTGILSLFAKQAGARKVFAVEASPMVGVLREIVELNDPEKVIEVVHGKAEEVELTEGVKVDVMISEWMGFYLLHESMLDSVILARDKHLGDEGVMFPSHAELLAAPVQMDSWVAEQFTDWSAVFGFNMTPMAQRALEQRLASGRPEVICLKQDQVLADPVVVLELDLRWVGREEVARVKDRKFVSVTRPGNFHGLALWFSVKFSPVLYDDEVMERLTKVELGTGPRDEETHWKQTVILTLGAGGGADLLEEDEVVGWDLDLVQSAENCRQYSLGLTLLDPAGEEHPMPCSCRMGRCALFKALLDKEEQELEQLEEINSR